MRDAYLDCAEDSVRFAGNADNDGALLHGLGGILDLEYPALGRAARAELAAAASWSVGAGTTYNVTESLS